MESDPHEIDFLTNEFKLKIISDVGIFSRGKIDSASKFLVENITILESEHSLDFGCGYGFVGMYLQKKYNCSMDYIDVNKRACNLTIKNLDNNNLSGVVFCKNIPDKNYDNIILNPPIHSGKSNVYSMFKNAHKWLKKNGKFYIVISKKHGRDSAIKKLKEIFNDVKIIKK